MRSAFSILLALITLVQATAIDNSAEAADIISKSVTLGGGGDYHFTNVATGKTLSFTRDDQSALTNIFAILNGLPLGVQFKNTMARLSGGNNKCLSAQWNAEHEGGVDYAAVSYACAVGKGLLTGTDTLETTKQWWYIVPAGMISSKGPAKMNDMTDASSLPKNKKTGKSKSKSKSKAKTTPRKSLLKNKKKNNKGKKTASKASKKASPRNAKMFAVNSMVPQNDDDASPSTVNPKDRSTWICKHPGDWLVRHSGYVTTGGHTECASRLAAAQKSSSSRMRRRNIRQSALHARALAADVEQQSADLAKRSNVEIERESAELFKRAQVQSYYLIAVDHIQDMATRAVSSAKMSTAGGYTSTVLALWDKTDVDQRWIVTPSAGSTSGNT